MPTSITLTSVSGLSPFHIYVCDTGFTSCIYVNTVTPIDIPYQISIPPLFSSLSNVVVKVVDTNDCEIKQTVLI
jgi:hypothetical protein